jgi:hypothetical protein
LANLAAPPLEVLDVATEISSRSRADNLAKQRSLYVDYKDGVISRPSDITEGDARNTVRVAKEALQNARPVRDPGYRKFLVRATDAQLAPIREHLARLLDAIENDDAAAAVGLINGVINSGGLLPQARPGPAQTPAKSES